MIDGADASQVERALKTMTEDEVRTAISSYLETQKAKDHGITLSIALSKHSLNLFRANAPQQTAKSGPSVLDKIRAAERELETVNAR